jgi:predicted nucleic acid-binding protein
MPAAEVFLDSNVLIYAMSDAPGERPKRDRASALIALEDFGTSYQVLMETWVVASYKMEKRVAPEKIAAFLEKILVFPCAPGTEALYRKAFVLAARYRIHPYDAAIVAAAGELKARILYSEDLNHGQEYDRVTVVNPFKELD